jgi:hypothetical protein
MSLLIMLYQVFGFPLGIGITLIVVWYFLRNPEKFERWMSMIAWVVSHFWKNVEYFATKMEIQGRVNSFVSTLESNTTMTFPRVSLKWKARGSDEIIWDDGRAIIVMRDRSHRSKNLIHAAYLFTAEALLKKSARHLSKTQKTSFDLFSTKLILEKESKFAVEQFMCEYFLPEIDKNEAIRWLIQQYVHIERIGAFFPILIQELTYLGSKVFLSKPSSEVVVEVKSLVEFLEKFSEREVGDITTADTFVGKYMRCAIRIVASRAIRERGDITSHKERINCCVRGKFENIYIIGSGVKENKKFMDEVAEACLLENEGLEKVRDYQFKGQIKINGNLTNVSTYLIHLHNPCAVKYLYEANDINTETV